MAASEEGYVPRYARPTSQDWFRQLNQALVCEKELTEDACAAIAEGFTEVGWQPEAEELREFRAEFEPVWRAALIDNWKATKEELTRMSKALKGKPQLVGSMLRSMTDEIRKEQQEVSTFDVPDQNPHDQRRKLRVPKMRIPIHEEAWGNYVRLHLNTNLTKLAAADEDNIEKTIKTSGLRDLLKASMTVTEMVAAHFANQPEPGANLNDLSHREDWNMFQTQIQELREVIAELGNRDPVQIITGEEHGAEKLHVATMETFVAAAIYFGHLESQHMINWHPTSTGKCKGVGIAKLGRNLKHLEDLTSKMMAAGQLVAALGTNKKKICMQRIQEWALWTVTEVPALMSPLTRSYIRQRAPGADACRADAKGTDTFRPYAYPPDHTSVYGKSDAPLAGIMDKTMTLDAQLEAIGREWSTKTGGKAIAAINGCTTLVFALQELPTLRDTGNLEKCSRVPEEQKAGLAQSLLTDAPKFAASAERAGDHDAPIVRILPEVVAEVDRLVREGRGLKAEDFLQWLTRVWDGTEGVHSCTVCDPAVAIKVGKDPRKAMMRHLTVNHSTEEKRRKTKQEHEARHRESTRPDWRAYAIDVEEQGGNRGPTRRTRSPSTDRDWETTRTDRRREPKGRDNHQKKKARRDKYQKSLEKGRGHH